MNKWFFRFSVLSVLFVAPALGADLTITTATTDPVNTADGDGSGAGDITITEIGSIELDVLPIPDGEDAAPVTVPAITLNSQNNVTHDGSIVVRHFDSPVGILIGTGSEGDVTIGGSILVEGTDDGVGTTDGDGFLAPNSIGLELNSSGGFVGNIVTEAGSSIIARGRTPTGIFLRSNITGDVLLDGSTSGQGNTAVGIQTLGSISGTFRNNGLIKSEPKAISEQLFYGSGTSKPLSPGSALIIGGNVGEGVLNNGPNNNDTPRAEIFTQGTAPALRISPSLEFGADLTIGKSTRTDLPENSFANRGDITAQPLWPEADAIAVQVGGSVSYDTIFTHNFYNSGKIHAYPTSSNSNATSGLSKPSNATAILLGDRSIVPEIINDAGWIRAITAGPEGGNAFAIDIDKDASLPRLVNRGDIYAFADSTDEDATGLRAFGIRDRSGSLVYIENSGMIAASAVGINTTTVAVDLSEATTPITLDNRNEVLGDVFFGSGGTPSIFYIQGEKALVSGAISSGSTVNITVSDPSMNIGNTKKGGHLNTPSVRNAGIFEVFDGGKVTIELGQETGPLIDIQGAGNFAAGSSLFLSPISFIQEQKYELVRADGGLTIAAGVTDTAEAPFLFNGIFSSEGDSLFLDVVLKSATELGLEGNGAAIYQGVAHAALNDDELGAFLLGVSSNAAVQDTVKQFAPHDNNISRSVALMLTDPTGSKVSGRQRRLQLHPNATDNGGVWISGEYNIFKQSGTNGFDGTGGGGAIGIDWGERDGGHFGVAYNFFHGGADGKDITARSVDTDWSIFSFYMGIADGSAFLDAQANIGFGKVEGKREVNVEALSRTANTRDWSEMLASGNVSAGYKIDLGELQFAPQGGVEYTSISRSAYTETNGGAGVNLSVQDSQEHLLRGFFGASFGGEIDSGGISILPLAHFGAQHNFLNDMEAIIVQFTSVPGTSYTTFGQQPGTTAFVGGLALDVSMGWWSVGTYYDTTMASGEITHSAGGNMYIRF